MAKRRKPKPLIVTARLDECLAPYVTELSDRSGWSFNRALSHLLYLGMCSIQEDKPTTHMLRRERETAMAEKHIREDAAAKIKALRKAEATP